MSFRPGAACPRFYLLVLTSSRPYLRALLSRQANGLSAEEGDGEAEKKRARLEKLAAWRSKQAAEAGSSEPAAQADPQPAQPPAQPEVWCGQAPSSVSKWSHSVPGAARSVQQKRAAGHSQRSRTVRRLLYTTPARPCNRRQPMVCCREQALRLAFLHPLL